MTGQALAEDPSVLEKLREHEVRLERRLEDARREAREAAANAAAQAVELRREAEQSLARELEVMRCARAHEANDFSQRLHEDAERERHDLDGRYRERRATALAFVLRLLTGEEVS